jgi:bifunctional DNA-binding transcriptional regulator/antitoxin component of YhaV-PrlF toxin-antitoxin module
MAITTFSTKGQVVIPKALREAKGFDVGVQVEAVDHPDGVLLKAVPVRKKQPIAALIGLLQPRYKGPVVTVAEMNQAVVDAAADRFLRTRG